MQIKKFSYLNLFLITFFLTGQFAFAFADKIQQSLLSPETSDLIVCKIDDIIKRTNPYINIGLKITTMSGDIIYEKNAHQLFTPASNIKLITAAAAFYYLKETFCFQTKLLADGNNENGTLNGNLYLKGNGDPTFTNQDLEKMVKNLVNSGIKNITGALCIDCSDYDDKPHSGGCCFANLGESFNSPIFAIILNRNPIKITNRIINFEQVLLDIGQTLHSLCQKYNIKVTNKVLIQQAPSDAKILTSHNSESLASLISQMLKPSDNLFAETLFKKIGANYSKTPGSFENGIKAIEAFLNNVINISPNELLIDDGSGMSRYTEIAPDHFIKLLQWISTQPFFDKFVKCLPICGIDGTLKSRMLNCAGHIKAKTGSMNGISSLSGYFYVNDSSKFIFSILINDFIQRDFKDHPPINYKKEIEDEICTFFDGLIQNALS